MDQNLLNEIIHSGHPFQIEVSSGRVFHIEHQDFISFSVNRMTLIITYQEDGKERIAMVPLRNVVSASTVIEPSEKP